MRTCKNCGKNIDGMRRDAKYCCRECKDTSRDQRSSLTAKSRLVNHASRKGLLTLEQEHELGYRAMDGDIEARNALVEHNMKIAVEYAKRAAIGSVTMDDAMAGAVLGMLTAASRYDPTKLNPGAKFITYAKWWIMAEMQHLSSTRGSSMSFPRNTARLHPSVGQIVDKLANQGAQADRDVIISEIVKKFDCTKGVADSAYDGWVAETGTLSMDYMAAGEDTDMHNTMVCSSDPVDIDTSIDCEVIIGYAYRVLSGLGFAAFMLRYFGDRELMTLDAVGAKIRRTRERSRQLILESENKIKAEMKRDEWDKVPPPVGRKFSMSDVIDEIGPEPMRGLVKKCEFCREPFLAGAGSPRYCSTECSRNETAQRRRNERESISQ
jgi:RNA polymerase nonessential primary-like sigma factor